MILLFILASFFGQLCSVWVFEHLYPAARKQVTEGVSKAVLCRSWWGLLALMLFLLDRTWFLGDLPLLLLIGASHTDLCKSHQGMISLKEALANIPHITRQLHSYLKGIRLDTY